MSGQLQHTSLPSTRPEVFVARARRCLRCDQMFDSAWAGERICAGCRGDPEFRDAGSLGDQYL